MAAQLGINVPGPDNADPAAIAATGASWVRTVYRDNLPFRSWLVALESFGIKALLVGDSSPESLGPNEGQWAGRMTVARSNLGDLVKWWQWGNEPDGSGPASWPMPWQQVNRLVQVARAGFPREQGFKLIGPGLVSGDTNWPAGLRFDLLDALDAHPYAKDSRTAEQRADLNGMLDRYRAYGLPLWLGEYDSRTDGLSSYLRVYPGVDRAAVFCWSSDQTAGEGITGMGIRDNPTAMASFKAATAGQIVNPPPSEPAFVLGFKEWHDAAPALIGAALENERGGRRGLSFQDTSKGFLTAAYLADPEDPQADPYWQLTFFDKASRARYAFEGGETVRIA